MGLKTEKPANQLEQLEQWYKTALGDTGMFAKRYVVLFDYCISRGWIKLTWTPPPH